MEQWDNNWEWKSAAFKKQCLAARANFLAALAEPLQAQKRVLKDILQKNNDTEFGEEHSFAKLTTIKEFQHAVPIRAYEQFEPWIEREIVQKGGVLGCETPERWLKTSGSTGNSKKIPYTKYWMEKYRAPALEVLWGNYLHYVPEMLAHPFATLDTQTVREESTEFLNGIPYQGITNRNHPLTAADWQPPWYDAPWFTEEVPTNYDAKMYYRLRYFLGQDLRAILTINPSTLLALKHHLSKNLPQLVTEIVEGTLNGKQLFAPNPDLAAKLTALGNSAEFSFKEIWPNLKLISCWTSASAKLYMPKLQQLFPGVKILPFMSCGTEGIVTLPVDEHTITGPLAITQGFYEFLPAEVDLEEIIASECGVEALLFNELELGKEYHLIMTQGSGMCRYAVGDIYKVTDFYNGVPRIEYARRNGSVFSFTGEKLTEQQLVMAVDKLAGGLFMCNPVWGEPPYYKMALEVDSANSSEEVRSLLESKLDQILRDDNEEYESKRKSSRLGKMQLSLIKIGTVEKVLEAEKRGKNATQFKYKPFQKNDELFQKLIEAGANV